VVVNKSKDYCRRLPGTHLIFFCFSSDTAVNAEDTANQNVRMKEEQLRKEEEKVSDFANVHDNEGP
jgi:hypothetical protein